MSQSLRSIWEDATNLLRCGPSPDEPFAEVVAAYTEPGRHYHTLDHLAHMFAILDPWKTQTDWPPLALATFYHDFTYDSRRADNESQSADAAEIALAAMAVAEKIVDRVRELILFTKSHQAPEQDRDGWLFLDADLSILAATRDRYDEYRRNVRQEYAWVAEDDFRRGRRAVLATFLERERIYRILTDLEGRARANLTAEIAEIDQQPGRFFVDEGSRSG